MQRPCLRNTIGLSDSWSSFRKALYSISKIQILADYSFFYKRIHYSILSVED